MVQGSDDAAVRSVSTVGEAYEVLADAMSTMGGGSSAKAQFREFRFLSQWNTLSDRERRSKYAKFWYDHCVRVCV